jgi:hypothetical protein
MAKKISTIVEKYKRWQVDKVKSHAGDAQGEYAHRANSLQNYYKKI